MSGSVLNALPTTAHKTPLVERFAFMSDFSHQTGDIVIRGVTFGPFVFDIALLPGAVLGSGIVAP